MVFITTFFISLIADWRAALHTQNYVMHLIAGLIFFVVTLIIEMYGGEYTKRTAQKSPPLSDILLDFLPTVDLNFLYVETMGTLMTVFCLYQLTRPQTVPYVLATLSLFTLVRRAFLIMTPFGAHEKTMPNHGFKMHRKLAHKLFQGDGDYFFSGHTGLPFLFFLLTPWPPLAAIFLISSLFMAIAVLYMHVHYSIDVFAAPFITYTIFVLSRVLFM